MKVEDLKKFIRDIPNFPKEGIVFKDITPLLKDSIAFRFTIDRICEYNSRKTIQKVVAMEARGFIFGSAVAYKLGCGFVPVRKRGKLPYETISLEYQLEYGTDVLEIHKDGIEKNDNVLIVDDVVATGGTAKAVANLVEKCGGKVAGMSFVIELSFLTPRVKLEGYDIFSLLVF
ncbi:MAG: adenine phosphoribosyltransferase [Endomicrobia bacterium]|nr:adenine phosphoribosyltransferase [Endomicrobiia bacterium]MCX7941000.1 adenine phosphoribosyltransferase [Endomicrobiia bacterium]MDW8055427.1 adenine phosphoribosyltransferase [Elusimicrobiota bacterium]